MASITIAATPTESTQAQSTQAQPTLHTAKGFYADARLTNIDADGRWQFRHQEQEVTLPGNQIVRWSSGRATAPGSAVALFDGSWLAGQLQWPSERRLKLVSKWFEAQELDIDSLRAVLVNPSPSWPETQQLQTQMLSASGSQDTLWKRGSESASGIVTIQIKKGIDANSPDRAAWSFKPTTLNTAANATATASATEVPQVDVAGVTFSPILRRPTPPDESSFAIHLIDGSRLIVKDLLLRKDGRIECNLAANIKLVSLDEADQFVLSIAQITAKPVGITWLSELEPARYRLLESDSRVPWPLGRNRDLLGQKLFDAQGQAIEHALVIHSPAQVAYRFESKPARLIASIEILKNASSGSSGSAIGSAQCQVLVGRNGQLTRAWQSEVIRTGQSPVNLDVDVSNSQLVVLLVDPADLGTLGDHVLWRDVRVAVE